MLYKFDAVDTLFFRSSVPFDRGAENSGECVFPPLPSVYAGALNSCAQKKTDKRDELTKSLKLGLSGLMKDNVPLFPVPRDLHMNLKNTGMADFEYLKLEKSCNSNYPLGYMFETRKADKSNIIPEGSLIAASEINKYLNAEKLSCKLIKREDCCTTEYRVGIQIDNEKRTAEDKYLYSISQVRPKDGISLFAEAQGIDVSDNAYIRLGGEAKIASVHSLESKPCAEIKTSGEEKFFKLYIATPAIFKNGWLPWWIKSDKTGVFAYKKRSVCIKLVCASIPGYVPVGGFSNYRGKQKPRKMHYAVAPGAVYYFKIESGTIQDVIKLFNGKCISDYREHCPDGFVYENWDKHRYCDRGFGYCLVGKLTDEQISSICEIS